MEFDVAQAIDSYSKASNDRVEEIECHDSSHRPTVPISKDMIHIRVIENHQSQQNCMKYNAHMMCWCQYKG